MRKAIFYRLMIAVSVAVVICGMLSAVIYSMNEEIKTEQWLAKLCYAVALDYDDKGIKSEQVQYLSTLAGGDRVTIIASNGDVLADSVADSATMENHLSRYEVANANETNVVTSLHQSKTIGKMSMYATIKTKDGNILRIAHSYDGMWGSIIKQLSAIIIAMLIALMLSIFIAGGFAKTLISPLVDLARHIKKGSIGEIASSKNSYDEIDKIVYSIKGLVLKMDESSKALASEREKIDFVLSSMKEGFVMLDEDKKILLVNSSAKAIFNCVSDVTTQNILMLTRDIKIEKAVERAIFKNNSQIFDIEAFDNKIISVHVSPVLLDYLSKKGKGATILLVDVTAERQSQKMRQEFFSNASHELKTPITSIRGFSEMLRSDMVVDEANRRELFVRIEAEAQRMTDLINDILMISRLETNENEEAYTDVDLGEVAGEVIETIMPQTAKNNISINLNEENTIIKANRRQMYELAINLIENAVKYNKQNGSVDVTVKNESGKAVLIVEDTGLGIPAEYQPRIFERFYRVDSGRSKEIGGTGLGLSIVKHIVSRYGGEITLASTENVGTRITIRLDKNAREI